MLGFGEYLCRLVLLVAEVEGEGDSISSLCTQITSAFSGPTEDPFSLVPMPKPASSPQSPATQGQPYIYSHSPAIQLKCFFNISLDTHFAACAFLFVGLFLVSDAVVNGSAPAFPAPPVSAAAAVAVNPPTLPPPLPARDTNPWAKVPTAPPAPAHPGKNAWSLFSSSPKISSRVI